MILRTILIWQGSRLWILMLASFACSFSHAAPNLQRVETIDGVTIIADHEQSKTFYYLKSQKSLISKAGTPGFRYSVNRYIGKKITGDEGTFWVRGVIKFSTHSGFVNNDPQSLVKQLERKHGTPITLRAAPVSRSFNRLVYATIEKSDDGDFSGVLEGGEGHLQTGDVNRVNSFDTQRFTIGLSSHDANLFWKNFEQENLALSLAYGWTINGLILDQNEQWVESSYAVNNSLPVRVSMHEHPELFTKNELWQRLSYAHTGLKIMCYDFINFDDSDLYYVNVEVRFKTKRNQYYVEQIKFTADSGVYEKDISFGLANDIKDGYQYRVRRLTTEGEMTRTDWLAANTAWIDVSMSSAELSSMETTNEQEQ